MAYHEAITTITLPQGEDLTDDIGSLLTLNSSAQVVKTANVTDPVVAVLAENPSSATVGEGVSVVLVGCGGVVPVKAGAAITAGQVIVPHSTDGKANGVANIAGLAANQMGAGFALKAASAADEFIEVLLMVVAGPTA